ncbi:hypothetical protein IE81DRAFT_366385 [Ceraceosorus guamensis]|uniref:Uncharacterized protein n=1 Tax=Ceraceosorus guamensis TaxID=1522189 RepID=A0A316VYQ3_9BASI|nr:hypothetical protein IE81DRAFT_366385 [Ceraceosorus guamensis]PWN42630.1 hypothetical protein IE81DRAFT_366385 [Ceraceosorus guamensis]
MDTQAGFFYEPGVVEADAGPSTSSLALQSASQPPQRLTATQSARLRNWLEDSLGVLHRGWQRRFAKSGENRFVTLDQYLDQAQSILSVLALIPQHYEGARRREEVKVPYLLRTTSELVEGVVGYDLRPYREEEEHTPTSLNYKDPGDAANAHDGAGHSTAPQVGGTPLPMQFTYVLRTFALLDAQWVALLDGKDLDYKSAQARSTRNYPYSGDLYEFKSSDDTLEMGEEWHASTLTGRHPRANATASHGASQRATGNLEGIRAQSGSGRALSQTDRVRLRNVVLDARARFMRWMRLALDAEMLDVEEENAQEDEVEESERRDQTEVGHAKSATSAAAEEVHEAACDEQPMTNAGTEDDEDELDMEEVLPQSRTESKTFSLDDGPPPIIDRSHELRAMDSLQDTSVEGRHFADLFARKLDPDADEEDSDSENDASHAIRSETSQEDQGISSRRSHTSPENTSQTGGAPKVASEAPQERTGAEPADTGVLMWEKAFSHLMAGTLRSLSEGNERQLERLERERNRAAGRPEDD